nr:ion channel [Leucobacter chromiireducens]
MRGSNLFRLLALLLVVAVACALGIFTVAREMPGQFSGIETRIDALYFTLTTMTTTGYGDIHAVGQFARALVSLILVFDLVFLGLFGAELSRIAQRTLGRVQGAAADQGHVNPPETAPERQKPEGPEHERAQAE